MKYTPEDIEKLNQQWDKVEPETMLRHFMEIYGDRIALSSSLSAEDQALTDMMLGINPQARIFSLDTGRLFPETYALLDKTNLHYGIKIEVFCPQTEALQEMVNTQGINLFYESIEKRHLCCQVRKLEPLSRAFRTLDAWVCGLRRSQSVTRNDMRRVEWDERHGLLKINPLIDWSEEQVWAYVREHRVPYNKLHDQGFPSIGCQPCTRAVKPGEDIRSGRWWWEDPQHRECGLHIKENHNSK
ncbi:MAG: phosphoadenylyl-sulfate reductase [Bacteroidales bacterium]|nr:phosphoadenylyl-sulfate reductase [Bacteroidales bacterium]